MDFGSWLATNEDGITEEQLRELPNFRDSDAFDEDEKLVLEYAEGITRTPVEVSDELFERLRERFDEAQIVDLTWAAAIENLRARFNWALRDRLAELHGGRDLHPARERAGGGGDGQMSDLVEDPVFNYRLRFHPVKRDILKMDISVDPGGGVSIPHYHPSLEERFEVTRGEVTFTADGEEIVAGPGEKVVVKPGVRHGFRNTGAAEAQITCEAEPAQDLQAFLTEAAAMARDGVYTKRGIPRGPGALLRAAEFTDRFRDTVVITARTLPPPSLQPALMGPLARLQRRRTRKKSAA